MRRSARCRDRVYRDEDGKQRTVNCVQWHLLGSCRSGCWIIDTTRRGNICGSGDYQRLLSVADVDFLGAYEGQAQVHTILRCTQMTQSTVLRSSYLGSKELQLHGQHYGQQQNAPHRTGAACGGLIDKVRLLRIHEASTVQDSVLQRRNKGKEPEVCPEREREHKMHGKADGPM